uniref:ABC1 atypical kinase-like domain-containing protein n=1 Tax=Dunaliella tertiolecta TaxID=3047 RepID=A0A7S3VLE5_DUNTE
MRCTRSSSSSSSSPGLRGSEEDLALVEAGVRCSLEQMLEDGFYHADPHPGNLLKMRDGRLAYLDFGMCGSLDKKTRQALVTSTLHLVNREYTRLADDFVNLGLLPSGADKSKVVPALTEVFQSALSAGVTNVSFSQLSGNLGRTMYQFNFRIPPYYTLLVRSLTVLEGIALASNPDYKVLGSAYPWIARRLLTDKSPELREALRALLYGQDGRFRFSRLESLLQEAVLTPPSSKPKPGSTSSGTSSGTNSSNGAANGGVLALLLGDEGEFVRDILLDELAKGIDGGWRLAFDASVDAAARAPALLFSPSWLFPNPMPNPSLISTTSSASSRGSSSSGGGGGSNQGWGGRPLPSSAGSAAGGSNSSSSALVTTSSDAQQSSSAQQGGAQGSSSSNGGSSGGAQPPSTAPTSSVPAQEHTGAMTYQGGLLMSALPRLSSQEDYEQVQGILQLSRAMAALVAIRREATSTQDRPSSSVRGSGSDSSTRGGRDIGGPGAQQDLRSEGFILPQPLTAVEQGSTALTWLATELLAVPPEMRAQALRLPGELASRVTSRILARTLRSLAGANGSSSSSSKPARAQGYESRPRQLRDVSNLRCTWHLLPC